MFNPQTSSPDVHNAAALYRRRAACCFVASVSEFLGTHLILHRTRVDQSQSNCPTARGACFYFNHQCLGFGGGGGFLLVVTSLPSVISIVPFERGLDVGATWSCLEYHWRSSTPLQELKQTSSLFSPAKRQIPTFKRIDVISLMVTRIPFMTCLQMFWSHVIFGVDWERNGCIWQLGSLRPNVHVKGAAKWEQGPAEVSLHLTTRVLHPAGGY